MKTKTIDDGGSFFPHKEIAVEKLDESGRVVGYSVYAPSQGIPIRDWLAGQETLSDYDHPDSWKTYGIILEAVNGAPPDSVAEPFGYFKWECEARAKMRFMRADAMIAARKGAKP